MQKVKFAKFDYTVELTLRRRSQVRRSMVRGTAVRHGLGRPAVPPAREAEGSQEAGADIVGGEEMVEKIQGGFMISTPPATPDRCGRSALGKVLARAG